MNLQNLGLGLVAVAVLGMGLFVGNRPVNISTTNNVPPADIQSFGSIPGNSLDGTEWTVGGVKHVFKSAEMARATTTPCDFVAPSASSTLLFAIGKFRVASTSTATWGRSPLPNATTTPLIIGAVTTGNNDVIGAISTSSATGLMSTNKYQFSPNHHLSLSVADASITLNGPQGTCQAEWVVN